MAVSGGACWQHHCCTQILRTSDQSRQPFYVLTVLLVLFFWLAPNVWSFRRLLSVALCCRGRLALRDPLGRLVPFLNAGSACCAWVETSSQVYRSKTGSSFENPCFRGGLSLLGFVIPMINNSAHIGGLLVGLTMGMILNVLPKWRQQ